MYYQEEGRFEMRDVETIEIIVPIPHESSDNSTMFIPLTSNGGSVRADVGRGRRLSSVDRRRRRSRFAVETRKVVVGAETEADDTASEVRVLPGSCEAVEQPADSAT